MTINPQTIEIKSGETVTVGEMKITNAGGGHKILQDADGQRRGDLSYAELKFETIRRGKN